MISILIITPAFIMSIIAPYTVYQFKIQAATAVGFGDFSPPRQFVTPESGKSVVLTENAVMTKLITEPAGVRNLSLSAVNFSAILVSWNHPECPYGIISRYRVHYKESDTIQSRDISSSGYSTVEVMPAMDTMLTQYEITGLTPDTSYAIHVRGLMEICPEGGNCELLVGEAEIELLERTPVDTTGI